MEDNKNSNYTYRTFNHTFKKYLKSDCLGRQRTGSLQKDNIFCGQFAHGVPTQKDGNYFHNFFVQFVMEDGNEVFFDVWPCGDNSYIT
jgi:hypothetical protein